MSKQSEFLVSIDGEYTGLIPGLNSMISLGAVAYTQGGEEISRFKVNIEELPNATRCPKTMQWWNKHSEAWEVATKNPEPPRMAMLRFKIWLDTLPGTPTLMGWPLPVDFMFVYWYYVMFVNQNKIPPFGYDGIDIKTYTMCALEKDKLSDVSQTELRKILDIQDTGLSHEPDDDAAQQAKLYFGLKALKGS